MSESEVRAFRVSLPPDLKEPRVKSLAVELVRRGKLTKFQALRLLEGKWQGLVLGKYVLREKIGEGGMGEVYKAEHRRMKRPVVVKILPTRAMEQPGAVELFQREVEAAAQVSHKNIVTAYDADESDGIHFLVMEYVDGESVGILVDRVGPFPVDATLAIVIQAASGLDYAHSKGIVHRDIKPNNLLLDVEGIVKVLDMGLARFDRPFADQQGESRLAENRHQIFGTVEYMPPEQADHPDLVDRRSDIYSLGCTMFRLLVGHPPYQGDTPVDTLLAHRQNPIPKLGKLRSDVPKSLDAIFARMVARQLQDRFSSMAELIDALNPCLRRPVKEMQTSLAELLKLKGPAMEPPLKKSSKKSARSAQEPEDATTAIHESATVAAALASITSTPTGYTPATTVGIDLGTTYSVVACLDELGRPRTLMNSEGEPATPSVLLLDDAGTVVGTEAVKALSDEAERVADCVKRELGKALFSKVINGRQFPPEALQAWILNKLRTDSVRQVGEFSSAVITVPAYFDEVRRKATQDAGYIAGFDDIDIINEPTAAAMAFGFHRGLLNNDNSTGSPIHVAVYDLGGGTFDVTILRLVNGEFRALATDGDVQLGGRDWDQRLMDFVAEEFARRQGIDPRGDIAAMGRLWRSCEDAKRTLSVRSKAIVNCECQGLVERVEVDVQTFQSLTMDLLDRTAFTTRETLKASGMTWDQIDHVLLVGGSTHMPAVIRMLRELTGKEPDASISPSEAVAHGAALYAGWLQIKRRGERPPFQVTNVNSHSLGVVATDGSTKRKQNATVIPRNTPLPVTAKRIFTTHKPNQRSILVKIVEGESSSPDDCVQLGRITVRNLPHNLPAQTPIEVRFRYEENGRLTVVVNVAGVDSVLHHEIARENLLTREQLDQWRKHISGKPPTTAVDV